MEKLDFIELLNYKEKLRKAIINQISYINEVKNEDKKYNIDLLEKLKKALEYVNNLIKNYKVPNLSNGVIELVRNPSSELEYNIYLQGSRELVGKIEYRNYHYDEHFGDIGYHINEKYRGNNYAYQAIELLSSLLNEYGIEDFWISAKSENTASLKIINKLGGVPISVNDDEILYSCSTNLSKLNNKAS